MMESGRCYGKETNVENLGKENFNATILSTDNDGKTDNVQDLHVKLKYRVAMTKAAFNKKKILFTSKFDIHLRKKLLKILNLEHSSVRC
jgi:hypothetical protein